MWYHMSKYKKLKEYLEQKQTPQDVELSDLQLYLKYNGFALGRVKGSHHIFVNKNKEIIVIPVHDGKVKAKYIMNIVKKFMEE